jgi:hypothetical protein
MFLLTECADYKPLYSSDKSSFNIGEIDYKGNDINIARKIGRDLKNIIRTKDDGRKINIIISCEKNKKIATKDTKGTATNFEMQIVVNTMVTETSSNEVLLDKKYIFQKIYQNKSAASETANLESKIIDDTVIEAVRLINIDIQTLK